MVDYFGVKLLDKEHTDHLISLLKEHYEILEDWEDKICWTHVLLGLQGLQSTPHHNMICLKSYIEVPVRNINKIRISIIPTYTTKLWRVTAVHGTRG